MGLRCLQKRFMEEKFYNTPGEKWIVETHVWLDRINQRSQKSNAKVIKNNYDFSKILNKI